MLLQTLNILENVDLKSMGYNSARYIHTLYQAMNLAFADRDFYYGDPYVPPVEPIKGLLSKEYARERFGEINWQRNTPLLRPATRIRFRARRIRTATLLEHWRPRLARSAARRCDEEGSCRTTRRSSRAHVDPGRGRARLGRLDHAERRLGAGVHRGQRASACRSACRAS